MLIFYVVFFKLIKSTENLHIAEITDTECNILIEIKNLILQTNIPSHIFGHDNISDGLFDEIYEYLQRACISNEASSYLLFLSSFMVDEWYIYDIMPIKNKLNEIKMKLYTAYTQILCYKDIISEIYSQIEIALKKCDDILEKNTAAGQDNLCSLAEINNFLHETTNINSIHTNQIMLKSLYVKEHLLHELNNLYLYIKGIYISWLKFSFESRPLKIRNIILGAEKCSIMYAPNSLLAQNYFETLDLILKIAKQFVCNIPFKNKDKFPGQENIFWMQIFAIYFKENYCYCVGDYENPTFNTELTSIKHIIDIKLQEWIKELLPEENSCSFLDDYNDRLSKLFLRPKDLQLCISIRSTRTEMNLSGYFANFKKMKKNILDLRNLDDDIHEIVENLKDIHKEIFQSDLDLQSQPLINILNIVERDFYSLKNALWFILSANEFYISLYNNVIDECLDSNVTFKTDIKNMYISIREKNLALICKINNERNDIVGIKVHGQNWSLISYEYDPISHTYLDLLEEFYRLS